MTAETAYEYKANVVRWIDGDTVELAVDLGFRLTRQDHFRLDGIDTAERGKPLAAEAKAMAMRLAPVGSDVTIFSHKADKYGRYLASIYPNLVNDLVSVNTQLVNAGLAKPYFGGKKE